MNAKTYLTASAITLFLVLSGSASAESLLDRIPNPFKKSDAKQAQQQLEEALGTQERASDAVANCGFTSVDQGRLGLRGRAQAELFRQALRQVSKSLDVEEIVLPDEIETPCEAETRWTYVEKKTAFWSNKMATATNKALEALDIDHQIEAERLFQDDGNYSSLSNTDVVTMRKDLNEGLQLVEEGIASKKEWNKRLLEEAATALRAGLTSGGEIAGWDQRLIEFMGSNMKWTINRLDRARNLKEHMELMGSSFVSIRNFGKARSASRKGGIDKGISAREEARVEAENAAFEEQLAKELEL